MIKKAELEAKIAALVNAVCGNCKVYGDCEYEMLMDSSRSPCHVLGRIFVLREDINVLLDDQQRKDEFFYKNFPKPITGLLTFKAGDFLFEPGKLKEYMEDKENAKTG